MSPDLSVAFRLGGRFVFTVAVLGLAACQEPLYSGLAEPEANKMRQVLMQQGIDADKRLGDDGKHVLMVPSGEVVRALRELDRSGLPKHKFGTTMDVLRTDSLVANPSEDRARLAWAQSQELAATISSIDGVMSARVHLVLPEKAAFGSPKGSGTPASASVFVKYRPGFNLNAVALSIRQLVARSVEGLAPENVSLTLLAAAPAPADLLEPTARAGTARAHSWGFNLGLLAGACLGVAGTFAWTRTVAAGFRAGDLKRLLLRKS